MSPARSRVVAIVSASALSSGWARSNSVRRTDRSSSDSERSTEASWSGRTALSCDIARPEVTPVILVDEARGRYLGPARQRPHFGALLFVQRHCQREHAGDTRNEARSGLAGALARLCFL